MKKVIKKLFHKLGYDIIKYDPSNSVELFPPDFREDEISIIREVRSYTMTRIERIVSLIRAVKYIVNTDVPGDIAECGVWRGGSMMAVAKSLLAEGDISRHLYLYDTFKGMPIPSDKDKYHDGRQASDILQSIPHKTGMWCYAGFDEVKENLLSTGYPEDKIHFIVGNVEDTLPRKLPPLLSLLRIDTDWYESTKHTLNHLFPSLNKKGILILDDYGCWQGARLAVDEYFEANNICAYLHRIDYSGRLIIKL